MLVPVAPLPPRPVENHDYPFGAAALTVVFAAAERTEGLRAGQRVLLADASVISPDDAYLVLPLRARTELLCACAKGHIGRISQWLEESVVVRADADLGPSPRLWVGEVWQVNALFEQPFRSVTASGPRQQLEALNDLPAARTLCPEGLFDAAALAAMLSNEAWLGPTGAGSEGSEGGSSWVFTLRRAENKNAPRVELRMVLVGHDEETFTAMIAPAALCLESPGLRLAR